jgi:S-adenosylmethionine decarboxylase
LRSTVRMRGRARTPKHPIQHMLLHALDAWVRDATVLTDLERVRGALYAGAGAGGATVVGEAFSVFSNGAVTGVLVLAQSHLSIHTWPEFALVNIDLLSYGDVSGDEVLRVICERLGAERAELTRIRRAVAGP